VHIKTHPDGCVPNPTPPKARHARANTNPSVTTKRDARARNNACDCAHTTPTHRFFILILYSGFNSNEYRSFTSFSCSSHARNTVFTPSHTARTTRTPLTRGGRAPPPSLVVVVVVVVSSPPIVVVVVVGEGRSWCRTRHSTTIDRSIDLDR